jgi:LacI family transcriptional regulator
LRSRRPQISKHRHLYETLEKAIREGQFAPGARLPTEAELMERFGVSRTTVIRTLRDLQSEGIVTRRQGSGSFVRTAGRPSGRPIGLLAVPEMEPHSIFFGVYKHLSHLAEQAGSQVLLEPNRDPIAALSRMLERGVSGVLYTPHGLSDEGRRINAKAVEMTRAAGAAMVLIGRDLCDFPERSPYDIVAVDDIRGGYLLGEHLVRMGCRRPVFCCWKEPYSRVRERWHGFREAVEAAGLEPLRAPLESIDSPYIEQMVRQRRPDGIACDNDRHAAIVMRHLLAMGRRVPQDVRLAGFDDSPTALLLAVPLTTVRQPVEAIASRAFDALQRRLADPAQWPVQVAVDVELIVRQSTDPAAPPTSAAHPSAALSPR